MKIVTFETGNAITHFDSSGATIGGVARCAGHVGVSFIELDPGGVLGMHAAEVPQLFLVVEGAGRVRSGDDAPVPIARGQGAFWEPGEPHETVTDAGLTAIVVEADELTLL